MHDVDFVRHMGTNSMSSLSKPLAAAIFGVALLGTLPLAAGAADLPNGMTSDTRKVSDLPGLQGFVNLPASEKSQFDIFYAVKIKHAPTTGITLTLNDHGRDIPLRMGP